jgi:uncharacterized membrane protein
LVHVLAAAIWVGGMIFVALVVVPVIRRKELQGAAARLIHFTGIRFRWVGWACFVLLLVTGLFNVLVRGIAWADLFTPQFWAAPFGKLLAVKLVVFALILASSALHDFLVGPRAVVVWQERPGSAEATRLRRQATRFGRLNLLLALTIVALGVMLVRGAP